jgi:cyclomaltodextrinase
MGSWTEHVVWWHVYPLGFLGAEQSAPAGAGTRHRLPNLVGWLDYLVQLGANGLALGPVFASETHGYDTIDHLRIDPRLGDEADLDALLSAGRERGVRVLLDGVFNHVGRSHPRFVAALEHGPDSPEGRWFRWNERGEPVGFEGHGALVTLNHDNPEVAEHVADVMIHWLDRGASGWRLDAAYAVPPEFWRRVLPRVRERHPDAWFLGEMIHGDYADYVERSGLDSVTQYELWKSVWSSLRDGNLFELEWTLRRHSELLSHFLPYTFVGNHDVTRIASTLPADALEAALALLFVLPGIPSVYYGDERGMRGVKEDRAGGDDAVRPAYPATPDELPAEGEHLLDLHRRLIGLRRRHAWLTRAEVRVEDLANESATIVAGERGGAGRVVLVLNLGRTPIPAPAAEGMRVDVSSTGGAIGSAVPPRGWAIYTR